LKAASKAVNPLVVVPVDEVAEEYPVAVAVSVHVDAPPVVPSPENVATPATAVAVAVPVSVGLPVSVLSASVTTPVKLVLVVPFGFFAVTTGCVAQFEPDAAPTGCVEKTRYGGTVWWRRR